MTVWGDHGAGFGARGAIAATALAVVLTAGTPTWGDAPRTSLLPEPRPAGQATDAGDPADVADTDAPVAGAVPPSSPPLPQIETGVPPGIAALTGAAVAPDEPATDETDPTDANLAEAPEIPVGVGSGATALAPPVSLLPAARPGTTPRPPAPEVAAAPESTPETPLADVFQPGALGLAASGTALAVASSLRPEVRPDGLEQRVRAAATRATPARVAQLGDVGGTLCGIPGLQGDRIQPITGGSSGCGIADPIRLRAVDGILLSQPATINCTTAQALQRWLQTSAIPTVGRTGGGIASLRVVASYACRTRNSQRGARLSEHALGNAIDIAGIGLSNGQELTVLGGWRDRRVGPLLQQMHRGACGPFGTVLGPNSDRFHQDHFHFDVASYRSGPYCR